MPQVASGYSWLERGLDELPAFLAFDFSIISIKYHYIIALSRSID
jgi:hypothetical protein